MKKPASSKCFLEGGRSLIGALVPLGSRLLLWQGSMPGSSLQVSAKLHSGSLYITYFSLNELHWCVFIKQPGDLIQMFSVLTSHCLVSNKWM